MPTNTLTDARCRKAAANGKPQKLFDGGGLHLFVSAQGGKTWRVAFRLDGKPQTKSLGPYPEVGLAAARAARDELKAQLRQGADPRKSAQRPKATKPSFKSACETYWMGRKDVSTVYRDHALRGLELHLWPELGGRQIDTITRADLLAELQRMDVQGLHVYVRKVRMWAGQVFEWAVETELCENNPAAAIRPDKAFGSAPVKHFAALELNQMPAFMLRLALEHDLQSVLACKLLAYTWVRTSELRFMGPSEIDGDVWRVPGSRAGRKSERVHLVPLSRQALDVIKALQARMRGERYLFEAEHRMDRPMSENAVLALLARMGYKGAMTGHGWRSVGSTWANERGYNADAVERQLGHVPSNEVRAAYNRAKYVEERRAMLQAWADWLDEVTSAAPPAR